MFGTMAPCGEFPGFRDGAQGLLLSRDEAAVPDLWAWQRADLIGRIGADRSCYSE
jgi:hypothetical protein